MNIRHPRAGAANPLYVLALGSLVALAILIFFLAWRPSSHPVTTAGTNALNTGTSDDRQHKTNELFMYCAAGMRYPLEEIVADYKAEYGVSVQLQYGGSNTLLNQLEVSKTGDLYLAGDDSYTRLAHRKGLVEERLPLATMRAVIAVRRGNPKNIRGVQDLLRDDVKVALGDPAAAAVGKSTRRLLSASGHWPRLQKQVAVMKPTVNDVANAVKLGSVDAGIIWDSTLAQYDDLTAVSIPELDAGVANIEIAVVATSKAPTTALRFARYVAARDRGLKRFAANHFNAIEGDLWSQTPELTFYAGAVNRQALEPAVRRFEQREGVTVNMVFNGCGVLTAQMRAIHQNHDSGFPDTYMACDIHYLKTVNDWFQDAVNVSDTDIVMVVQKGNPKNIRTLEDLVEPGVRVALGQPDQCTIGVLSRRLLQSEGIYQRLRDNGNIVTETQTSALLIPNITTRSADVVLAYRTDTFAERGRLQAIDIDSPLAKAIQPFSIARSSDFKYLGRRLFDRIAHSRADFESAGFNWRLNGSSTADKTDKDIAESVLPQGAQ